MKTSDIILQSFKNVRRQKLRSALTIFAVTIGATSVTIMLALVTGAQGFFVSQFSANGTLQQIAVSSQTDLSNFNNASHGGGNCDSCTKLTDALAAKVRAVPHVIGVARRISGGAFESVTYSGQKLRLDQMEGYDANGIITNTMAAGRDINASDTDGVITVTTDYADKWGFKGHYKDLIGKQVQLTSRGFYTGVGAVISKPSEGPGPGSNNQQQPPTILSATVIGVADSGNSSPVVRAPLPWIIGMNEQQRYDMTDADRQAQTAAQKLCESRPGPCQQPQTHRTKTATAAS